MPWCCCKPCEFCDVPKIRLCFRFCPSQKHDLPTDPAAADYYGAGNAERVAAARDKARRKLMSNASRDSCATPTETPGTASWRPSAPYVSCIVQFRTPHALMPHSTGLCPGSAPSIGKWLQRRRLTMMGRADNSRALRLSALLQGWMMRLGSCRALGAAAGAGRRQAVPSARSASAEVSSYTASA